MPGEQTTLKETTGLIEELGGAGRYVIADVHDEEAVREAVTFAAHGGRLDCAVNSAGVDGGNDSHPLIEYPVATVNLMPTTNGRGMFLPLKYELGLMAAAGQGSIVHISSGAGLTGVPGYSSRSVRVNAVCPGLVNTPLSWWPRIRLAASPRPSRHHEHRRQYP